MRSEVRMSSPEKHPSPADTNPTAALGRLTPLFSERSASEVAAVLDRCGNDVKEAAWALLNGETADHAGEADDETAASHPLPMARHLRAAGGEGADEDPDGDVARRPDGEGPGTRRRTGVRES
jgi:hypothetical protein